MHSFNMETDRYERVKNRVLLGKKARHRVTVAMFSLRRGCVCSTLSADTSKRTQCMRVSWDIPSQTTGVVRYRPH